MERMGRGPLEHTISNRGSGRTDRVASFTIEAEVGVRALHRRVRPTDNPPSRPGESLSAATTDSSIPRCRDGLRLLVLRERIDRSKRAHDRPGSRPGIGRDTPRTSAMGKQTSTRSTRRRGRLLWKTKADPHFIARITAGAKFYNGKLFVPVSSSEEFSSGTPDYPCCTSRGSVVALDANTGKQIWKAWVVPEEPQAVHDAVQRRDVLQASRRRGVEHTYGRSGPPGHLLRHRRRDDGAIAEDHGRDHGGRHRHGKLLWSYQATENDVFMGGCNGAVRSEACPNPLGPDMDIGNSPILKTLPNGKRVLLAGTKSADIFALDPDNNGALLYRVNPTGAPINGGRGGRGGIVWRRS